MLIKAAFQSKGATRDRIFCPHNVLYMDETGVLFAPQSHALWGDGEWERVQTMLRLWAQRGGDYMHTGG